MEMYIGMNVVQAEPALRGDCVAETWNYSACQLAEEGYRIRRADGYEGWSPREAFEAAYRKVTDGMTFGEAIAVMKVGHRVRRRGWNGKGMWIAISPGYIGLEADKVWNEHNKKAAIQNGGTIDILPYITMKTADNKIVCGWLASQTDMLAEDWEIV